MDRSHGQVQGLGVSMASLATNKFIQPEVRTEGATCHPAAE